MSLSESVTLNIIPGDKDDPATNLWVAGIILAAMGFLVAIKKGLGPKVAI